MTPEEATVAVIDALNGLGVPYMLVGSLSSTFYSFPRNTKDADFVVKFHPGAIQALKQCLGESFRLNPQMSFETITATSRFLFETTDDSFSVELFHLSEDAHDQERFSRRRPQRILDRDSFLPTAEDVIVTKLRWSQAGRRRKDLIDVENVIAVQGSRIDWDYVHSWCDRHGTRELLDEVRRSIPPPPG